MAEDRKLRLRDYRLMWLSVILAVAMLPLVVVLSVLFFGAKGVEAAVDALADGINAAHRRAYNADMARKYGRPRQPGAARPEGWLP